jgi:hypothetical protein
MISIVRQLLVFFAVPPELEQNELKAAEEKLESLTSMNILHRKKNVEEHEKFHAHKNGN